MFSSKEAFIMYFFGRGYNYVCVCFEGDNLGMGMYEFHLMRAEPRRCCGAAPDDQGDVLCERQGSGGANGAQDRFPCHPWQESRVPLQPPRAR